jgi:hypothetical protein
MGFPAYLTCPPIEDNNAPVHTRNRLVAVLISGVLAAANLAIAPPASASGDCTTWFAGRGTGTPVDPYQMSEQLDIAEIAFCLSSSFVQMNDVALTGTWTPIGTSAQPFRGTYDGGEFEINGLSAGTSSTDYVGLFHSVTDATISNVTVRGAVAARSFAGGLAGFATTSTFRNVHTNVTISAQGNSGGIVGRIDTGVLIEDSSASGDVSGANGYLGGLVGRAIPSTGSVLLTIRRSSASGDVTSGNRFIGGLFGGFDSSGKQVIIEQSFATGDVTGSNPGYVGGLVGFVPAAQITDSYALGSVNAGIFLSGGLLGEVAGGTFTRLYGVNTMLSTANRGGVVGRIQGTPTFTAITWDTTVGFANPISTSSTLAGTTGNTTEAMKSIATYRDLGWNIGSSWTGNTTWVICPQANNGYPFLSAFYTSQTAPCIDRSGPPPDVMQQVGRSGDETCATAGHAELNIGGVASGGWGQSWAQWMNSGTGGYVCNRTLYYNTQYGRWEVRT